jgi:hypothetical protein
MHSKVREILTGTFNCLAWGILLLIQGIFHWYQWHGYTTITEYVIFYVVFFTAGCILYSKKARIAVAEIIFGNYFLSPKYHGIAHITDKLRILDVDYETKGGLGKLWPYPVPDPVFKQRAWVLELTLSHDGTTHQAVMCVGCEQYHQHEIGNCVCVTYQFRRNFIEYSSPLLVRLAASPKKMVRGHQYSR